jgi:hypothetical protein
MENNKRDWISIITMVFVIYLFSPFTILDKLQGSYLSGFACGYFVLYSIIMVGRKGGFFIEH